MDGLWGSAQFLQGRSTHSQPRGVQHAIISYLPLINSRIRHVAHLGAIIAQAPTHSVLNYVRRLGFNTFQIRSAFNRIIKRRPMTWYLFMFFFFLRGSGHLRKHNACGGSIGNKTSNFPKHTLFEHLKSRKSHKPPATSHLVHMLLDALQFNAPKQTHAG